MGHSVGEVVAACIAGVFSLEDGLKLIAERGRLMGALPRNGAMVAVMADEARVRAAIAPLDARALDRRDQRAAPSSSSPAWQPRSMRSRRGCMAEGIDCAPLKVSHAFHSPLVEPMLDAFERVRGDAAVQRAASSI